MAIWPPPSNQVRAPGDARHFNLVRPHPPTGDQPAAIASLLEGLAAGARDQVLLGITGSGQTFTIANVIAAWGRPTLVLAPNKTLAAQLFGEFKALFPNNEADYDGERGQAATCLAVFDGRVAWP